MNSYELMYYKMYHTLFDIQNLLESDVMKNNLSEDAPQRVIAEKILDMIRKVETDCEEIYMEYGDEEDERYDRERDKLLGYDTL